MFLNEAKLDCKNTLGKRENPKVQVFPTYQNNKFLIVK